MCVSIKICEDKYFPFPESHPVTPVVSFPKLMFYTVCTVYNFFQWGFLKNPITQNSDVIFVKSKYL